MAHNFPVQTYSFCPGTGFHNVSNGIDMFAISIKGPVKIIEPVEVTRVNNCIFTFAEVNTAIGITVTEQAIGEQGTGENKVEPDGYCYC